MLAAGIPGKCMSDISFHFTWFELLLAAPLFGWPGLIIGAPRGALLWSRRRILGGVLGAIIGCLAWFAVRLLLL